MAASHKYTEVERAVGNEIYTVYIKKEPGGYYVMTHDGLRHWGEPFKTVRAAADWYAENTAKCKIERGIEGRLERQEYEASLSKAQAKTGNLRELNWIKKAILSDQGEFDADLFNLVQDEIDYTVAVRRDKQQLRDAKRATKGIKTANVFLAKGIKKKHLDE
jgi:hypothetical protein